MSIFQHFIGVHSVMRYGGQFHTVPDIQEAMALVFRFRIKTEVIGDWLFCFTSPLIGFQLEHIGFWYSYKHCAYIFSGKSKQGVADDESLDDLRVRLGSYLTNSQKWKADYV